MARTPVQIDRDKLRAELRKLGNEYIFYMLSDALELLPPAKLNKVAKKYLDLKRLRPDADNPADRSLLMDVRRFEKASLARDEERGKLTVRSVSRIGEGPASMNRTRSSKMKSLRALFPANAAYNSGILGLSTVGGIRK